MQKTMLQCYGVACMAPHTYMSRTDFMAGSGPQAPPPKALRPWLCFRRVGGTEQLPRAPVSTAEDWNTRSQVKPKGFQGWKQYCQLQRNSCRGGWAATQEGHWAKPCRCKAGAPRPRNRPHSPAKPPHHALSRTATLLRCDLATLSHVDR